MSAEARITFAVKHGFTEHETPENKFQCFHCKLWFPGNGIDCEGRNFEIEPLAAVDGFAVYCSDDCYIV